MKVLIISSLAVMCTVLVFGLNNYNDIAIHLRAQIHNVLANITRLRGYLNARMKEIPKSNFGLPNWISIARLQARLKGKARIHGVKDCQKKFNDSVQLLIEQAQTIAKSELIASFDMLAAIETRMKSVESKVTGKKNVDKEIVDCQQSVKCKMTGDYAKIIELDEKMIESNYTTITSPTLLQIIILKCTDILVPIIRDDILTPVNDCLKPF